MNPDPTAKESFPRLHQLAEQDARARAELECLLSALDKLGAACDKLKDKLEAGHDKISARLDVLEQEVKDILDEQEAEGADWWKGE